jgi:integrase
MDDLKPRKKGDKWVVDTGRVFLKRTVRRFNSVEDARAFIDGLWKKPVIKPDIDQTVIRFTDWGKRIKQKSPATIRSDTTRLKIFTTWAHRSGLRRMQDITISHIREFQEYYFANAPFTANNRHRRRNGGATAATWEKYRQILSALFNWCLKRGEVENNPVSDPDFKIKTQQKIPEIFTKEELRSLFENLDQRDNGGFPMATAFRLLAYTGLRLGELMRLEWSNVDLDNGVIKVVQTKSRKVRSIPIHTELLKSLRELPTASNRYLFDSGENTPLYTETWYWKALNASCKACGIKPRPVHSFRHTFAANLIMKGVDIVTVRDLLGHSDIKTTMIYAHFSPGHRKEAIDKLEY